MKKLCALLFGVAVILPVYAQDAANDGPADTATTDTAAPAQTDQPVAEADPADDSAPAQVETGEPVTDAASAAEPAPAESAETAPAEPAADSAAVDGSAPVSEEPAAAADAGVADPSADVSASSEEPAAAEEVPADPYKLYLGAGFNSLRVSLSSPQLMSKFGGQSFDAKMYTLRAGIRVFDVIGIELQGGAKGDNGLDANKIQITNYLGVFVVPTGNIFDLFEISAPIGFNSFQLIRGNSKESFRRPSYGLNIELPLRKIAESLPDFRRTSGYKIYYSENSARVYGYHLGLRFDFQI